MSKEAKLSVIRPVMESRRSLQKQICSLAEVADNLLETRQLSDDLLVRLDNILDGIASDLRDLISRKRANGYLEEITFARPESSPPIEQLIADHQRLLDELERLRRELHQVGHAPKVRRLLHGWITRFLEFDAREDTLIQNLWNVDVGTAD